MAGGRHVLKDSSGGGIIEGCVLSCVIGPCSHVVSARGLVGCEEDIRGLARTDHDDVGCEGLGVGCISADYRQHVIGNSEEELLIECSIDDPEENCLPRIHQENCGFCIIV